MEKSLSVLTILPILVIVNHLHNMVLPPPCFTGRTYYPVDKQYRVLTRITAWISGKNSLSSMFVSSDQRIFFLMFSECSKCLPYACYFEVTSVSIWLMEYFWHGERFCPSLQKTSEASLAWPVVSWSPLGTMILLVCLRQLAIGVTVALNILYTWEHSKLKKLFYTRAQICLDTVKLSQDSQSNQGDP